MCVVFERVTVKVCVYGEGTNGEWAGQSRGINKSKVECRRNQNNGIHGNYDNKEITETVQNVRNVQKSGILAAGYGGRGWGWGQLSARAAACSASAASPSITTARLSTGRHACPRQVQCSGGIAVKCLVGQRMRGKVPSYSRHQAARVPAGRRSARAGGGATMPATSALCRATRPKQPQ